MLNSAANVYPWYRDGMTQLAAGHFGHAAHAAHAPAPAATTPASIKTENNGYGDAAAAAAAGCMLAIDYAQNKVGQRD